MEVQGDMKGTLCFHTFEYLLTTVSYHNKLHVTSLMFKFNPLKHSHSTFIKQPLGCKKKCSHSVLLATQGGMN